MKSVLLFLHILLRFTLSFCQIIRTISEYNNNSNQIGVDSYHITQISPPGTYLVVLWSQLVHANFFGKQMAPPNECDENEIFAKIWMGPKKLKRILRFDILQKENYLAQLAKCFVHFYFVVTDENGKFLLQKNGTLSKKLGLLAMLTNGQINLHMIPWKNNLPIDFSDYWPTFPFQQIYSLANKVPVDSLCKIGNAKNDQHKNILNYFKAFADKKNIFVNVLRRWLFGFSFSELSDLDNFFLIAILKESLTECKLKWNSMQMMENENAILISIFWEFLGAKKNEIFKHLRLADAQLVGLIGEFCQINRQFLRSHKTLIDQIRSNAFTFTFCDRWPTVYDKSVRYTQLPIVFDAFSKWLTVEHKENAQINAETIEIWDEMKEIVKMWLEIFTEQIKHSMSKWPETDRNIFAKIGEQIENAANNGILTMAKFSLIDGSLELLRKICRVIHGQESLKSWRMICHHWHFQPNQQSDHFGHPSPNASQMANLANRSEEAESSNRNNSPKNREMDLIEKIFEKNQNLKSKCSSNNNNNN